MRGSIRNATLGAFEWPAQDDRILKLFASGSTEYAIVEHPGGTDQPRYEVVAFTMERTARKSLHSTDRLLEADGVFQEALKRRTSRTWFPWARWFRSADV